MKTARCPECAERFPINSGGHCRGGAYGGCCKTFRSDAAYAAHRIGPYGDRHCIDVTATAGWRATDRGWTNQATMTPEQRDRARRNTDSRLRHPTIEPTSDHRRSPLPPEPAVVSEDGSRRSA